MAIGKYHDTGHLHCLLYYALFINNVIYIIFNWGFTHWFLSLRTMDSSEKEPHFSEREEAIASMATIARTLSPPDIANHDKTPAQANRNSFSNSQSHARGTATGPNKSNISSKYRHIAAVHSRARTSCLSRDAEETPSFLGFRNLMVIVLSTCSFIIKAATPAGSFSKMG